eukprot:jgi/Botrbrau1/4890/Bobra.118_1s0004.1
MLLASSSDGQIRVHCSGKWCGSVTLPSAESTVRSLQETIASATGLLAETLVLIVAGRKLKDDTAKLSFYGIGHGSTVIVMGGTTKTNTDVASLEMSHLTDDDHERRQAALKRAAEVVAARSTDRRGVTSRTFVLENQQGTSIQTESDDDQKAVMVGLAMHQWGKASLDKEQYEDALDRFLVAEEAFGRVKSSILESTDNFGLLALDITWCYYQLKAVDKLADCRHRLRLARESLRRAHGPDKKRMRTMYGDFQPELATYARLEVMEGIAAYYAGQKEDARQHLTAASAYCSKLNVADEDISVLVGMGFPANLALRALRFGKGSLEEAPKHILDMQRVAREREAKLQQEAEDLRKQRRYGRSKAGALVDMKLLAQLSQMYNERLAAAALLKVENNLEAALDLLADANENMLLQISLSERKTRRRAPPPQALDEGAVSSLVGMGFPPESVRAVLRDLGACPNPLERAMDILLRGLGADAGPSSEPHLSDNQGAGNALSGDEEDEDVAMEEDGVQTEGDPAEPLSEAQRLELELMAALEPTVGDAMSAYDLDVSKEALAAEHYLGLLAESQ